MRGVLTLVFRILISIDCYFYFKDAWLKIDIVYVMAGLVEFPFGKSHNLFCDVTYYTMSIYQYH